MRWLLGLYTIILLFSVTAHGNVATLESKPAKTCPYDLTILSWSLHTDFPIWGAALYDSNTAADSDYLAWLPLTSRSEAARLPATWDEIEDAKHRKDLKDQSSSFAVNCEFDYGGCEPPKLTSIVASIGYEIGSTIDVVYDKDTDTPDASTKELVDRLLTFQDPIGAHYTGAWTNKRTLRITILDPTGHSNYHTDPVWATVGRTNPKSPEHVLDRVFGSRRVRLASEGRYQWRILQLDPSTTAAHVRRQKPLATTNVSVAAAGSCSSASSSKANEGAKSNTGHFNKEVVILTPLPTAAAALTSGYRDQNPALAWELRGTAASDGVRAPIILPPSVFCTTGNTATVSSRGTGCMDRMRRGSWSLCMWVYLVSQLCSICILRRRR